MLAELEYYAGLTKGRRVTSIFFGGGTPSLMPPKLVENLISRIQSLWSVSNSIEITLEANPTSVEADKFQAFKMAGVNRVSLGVQSLDDEQLKFLGRAHNADEATRAIEIAGNCFDRYSFDLIYARPDQSLDMWRDELTRALEYTNGHMSLYQLTIEKGTPFFIQHNRGEFQIPEDDLGGALYELTQDIMEEAGMPAYEVSNHAKPDMASEHNLTYWRYDDYVGIGPGAHGRLTLGGVKQATRGHRVPDIWLDRVEENGHGGHPFEVITPKQQAQEMLMMGLRITEKFDLNRIHRDTGIKALDIIDFNKAKALQGEGFLTITEDSLKTSTAGRQRLNALLDYILI